MRPTAGFTFQVFDGGEMTREIRQIDIFFKNPQNANKIIKKAGDRVFGHNQNSYLEYLSTDLKKKLNIKQFSIWSYRTQTLLSIQFRIVRSFGKYKKESKEWKPIFTSQSQNQR